MYAHQFGWLSERGVTFLICFRKRGVPSEKVQVVPTMEETMFKFFLNNCNNIKNTWKGITTIISIKNITITVPHSIEFNNRTITDPTAMSNVFDNYFTSIVKKTNSNIKFSPKHYTDYYHKLQTQIPFSLLQLTKMKYLL